MFKYYIKNSNALLPFYFSEVYLSHLLQLLFTFVHCLGDGLIILKKLLSGLFIGLFLRFKTDEYCQLPGFVIRWLLLLFGTRQICQNLKKWKNNVEVVLMIADS